MNCCDAVSDGIKEINRLNAEVERQADELDSLRATIKLLIEENDRLRMVIQDLANTADTHTTIDCPG